jgi:hypothetical protein
MRRHKNSTYRNEIPHEHRPFLAVVGSFGRRLSEDMARAGNQKQVVWQTDNIERGLYFIILRLDNRIVSQTKVSVQK